MSYKAKIKIGNMVIEADFTNMKDLFKWSSTYSNLPSKCHTCKNENLTLSFKSPQSNDYYMLKCTDCGAEANFGQPKDNSEFYWKWDNKLEKYNKDANNGQQEPPQEDDLPF